jgi:flagellar hook-basal body complex protein FliE
MPLPIDPSLVTSGAEWQIKPIDGAGATESAQGSGFGGMLGNALESLATSQTEAATGAQALAAGTAQDPTAVVVAVERAQLSMQLASQIRNKLVEAAQDIFHTQI